MTGLGSKEGRRRKRKYLEEQVNIPAEGSDRPARRKEAEDIIRAVGTLVQVPCVARQREVAHDRTRVQVCELI